MTTTLSTHTADALLVTLAASGDAHAFREIVTRYQKRAEGIAYSVLRNHEDARDVAQEAFMRVHANLGTFTGESSFGTWFHRIVTNLAIDAIRRRRGTGRSMVEANEETLSGESAIDDAFVGRHTADPFAALASKRLGDVLGDTLDALSPAHRDAILAYEVDGFDYKDIAERQGVPVGTVMSRLFHGRKRAQAMLTERLGGECPVVRS